MTKEQEAIEYLKESVLIYKNTIPKISKAIEIVLNMLKEKDKKIEKLQKENEYWKKGFEKELDDNRKSTCELIKQDLIIRKQDKIIYLMVDFMYKSGTGRRMLSCMFRENNECNENGCKYCIKQYFERKASDERN